MNKKEVSEIKSLYDSIEECGITRLAGCYVNSEKEKKSVFSTTFLNLPDEEMYKYLDIFRKTLSGTIGKNLVNMEFVDQLATDHSFGRGMLSDLYRSELGDDGIIDDFFDSVIASYDHVGSYIILLIHQNYDVPGKTKDGLDMEDASDEVYPYILCSICPMNLTKPGLGFDETDEMIHTLKQVFGVEQPEAGFLYPAFNDRGADESALLYYTKKTDLLQNTFLSETLDVRAPLPAKHQKESFTELVSEVLGEDANLDTVIAINDNLADMVEERKDESDETDIRLDKNDIRRAFENTGLPASKLVEFDTCFDEKFDVLNAPDSGLRMDDKLSAENVVAARKYEVKNSDIDLKINTRRSDIMRTEVIDGVKCLVIEITADLTVNGVPIR